MPWFELKGDERIRERCASEGCPGGPTYRLEAEGIGSNYCSGCKAMIEEHAARLQGGSILEALDRTSAHVRAVFGPDLSLIHISEPTRH